MQNIQEDSIISQILSEDKTSIPEPTKRAKSKNEILGNLNAQTVNKSRVDEQAEETQVRSVQLFLI